MLTLKLPGHSSTPFIRDGRLCFLATMTQRTRASRVHLLTEVKRAKGEETKRKIISQELCQNPCPLSPLPISPAADPNPRSQARDPGARGDGRRRRGRRGGGAHGAGDGALRPPDPRLGRRCPEEVRRAQELNFCNYYYCPFVPAPSVPDSLYFFALFVFFSSTRWLFYWLKIRSLGGL